MPRLVHLRVALKYLHKDYPARSLLRPIHRVRRSIQTRVSFMRTKMTSHGAENKVFCVSEIFFSVDMSSRINFCTVAWATFCSKLVSKSSSCHRKCIRKKVLHFGVFVLKGFHFLLHFFTILGGSKMSSTHIRWNFLAHHARRCTSKIFSIPLKKIKFKKNLRNFGSFLVMGKTNGVHFFRNGNC